MFRLMIFKNYGGGSRTAATSKMEGFVIIVNGFQPLTIITKRSILDVAAALNQPLQFLFYLHCQTIISLISIITVISEIMYFLQ